MTGIRSALTRYWTGSIVENTGILGRGDVHGHLLEPDGRIGIGLNPNREFAGGTGHHGQAG